MPTDVRQDDDRELARQAHLGCRASFDVLVQRHRARLLHAVRRRLPRLDEAEDVTQEALLRAWAKRDAFDPERAFWPWLLTLAMRLAVDHARRRGRRPAVALDGDVAIDADAADRVIEAERRRDVWALADRVLDARQRTALWLVYGESMTPAEAATALRISPVHARVTLHRAKAKLRPHLARFDDQEDSPAAESSPPAALQLTEPQP